MVSSISGAGKEWAATSERMKLGQFPRPYMKITQNGGGT